MLAFVCMRSLFENKGMCMLSESESLGISGPSCSKEFNSCKDFLRRHTDYVPSSLSTMQTSICTLDLCNNLCSMKDVNLGYFVSGRKDGGIVTLGSSQHNHDPPKTS